MKIIISPSKTQNFTLQLNRKLTIPQYDEKANRLVERIKHLTKLELAKTMKIKGKLLDDTYSHYQNYHQAERNHAITSYTGFVYKEIKWMDYTTSQLDYMENHLRILSALYGVLKPLDGIKPYRLDMKMKISSQSLYNYWAFLQDYFKNESMVINLASEEYSQLIKTTMINIHFLQYKDGKYHNIGTYAKKARGLMVDYLIKNQIDTLSNLIKFHVDDYQFNDSLSDDNNLYFTR